MSKKSNVKNVRKEVERLRERIRILNELIDSKEGDNKE